LANNDYEDKPRKRNFLKNFRQEQDDLRNAGRSFVYFLVGMALMAGGLFLIFQNTVISSGFSLVEIIGFTPPTGVIIIPLLLGIGILFFNGKSWLGWLLTILGLVTIVLGIIMGLRMYFKPTTLYQGLIMFGMTAAGAGLFLKALVGKNSSSDREE